MDAWDRYWSGVGNEDYLAAKQLLDISPRVTSHFSAYAVARRDSGWEVQWPKAVAALDSSGMSSTERRLAELVAGMIGVSDEDGSAHPIDVRMLGNMGSWTDEVLRVLVKWASDGRLDVTGRLLADDPWVKSLSED